MRIMSRELGALATPFWQRRIFPMFTTISAKKTLFTLIGTLLILCSFSTIGCRFNVISEIDKKPKIKDPPDSILAVGDKLPDFRNDINWDSSSKPINYMNKITMPSFEKLRNFVNEIGRPISYAENAIISERRHSYIRFLKKGIWIELGNGTCYICATPTGCEIIDFAITEGTIEVYHNKNGN